MSEDPPPWGEQPEDKPQFEPPTSAEAEMALLAAVLMKPSVIEQAAEWLRPEQFSEEALGALWGLFLRHHERNQPIQIAALLDAYAALTGWGRKDTAKALAKLAGGSITTHGPQVLYYAEQIRDGWMRRRLLDIGDEVRAAAVRPLNGAPGILEYLDGQMTELTGQLESQEHAADFATAIDAALQQAQVASQAKEEGRLIGVTSGLGSVDRKLGGFRDTDVIIIGGATGMAKTATGLRIANAAAKQFKADNPDKPRWVHFFSLEMSEEQLAMRSVSAQARISFEKIRLGNTDARDLMALEKAGADLRDLPIRIDASAGISVGAIRARARRLKRKKGLGLIVIDYLQLIGVSADDARSTRGNRVQEIGIIMRGLKGLAKELNVPVIALCQLSRRLEEREYKRPQLSDLRESGEIEMTADVVAFVYREAYYLLRRPPAKREKEKDIDFGLRRSEWAVALESAKDLLEFIIAKNRHGSCSTLAIKFLAELMLLEDDTPGDATQTESRKQQLRMELMVD